MVSFSYFSQLGQFSEICTLVKRRIVVESVFIISNMERAGKFNRSLVAVFGLHLRDPFAPNTCLEMQRPLIAGMTSSAKIKNLPIPLKF